MPEPRRARGLLDTSAAIDLERLDIATLPLESSICTVTIAELTAGPLAATDPMERAARQARLQLVESRFASLSFDVAAARAYGRIHAATAAVGRKPRGARALDLLIAAVALANGLSLHTRNAQDVDHLAGLLDVVEVTLEI